MLRVKIVEGKRQKFADALSALGATFDDDDLTRLLFLARGHNYSSGFSTITEDRIPHILKARKRGATLQEIGTSLGITRERVRQIILKYEELQGCSIEVGKIERPKPRGPRVARIEWRCPNCDAAFLDTPSKAKTRKTQRLCGPCARNAKRKVTDAVIEKAIAMRLEGIRWNHIGDIFGTSTQSIQRGIWNYLARRDSLSYSRVDEIWNATTYKNAQPAYNVWIKATGLEPAP